MPKEDRRIIFDLAETYRALYKLTIKQNEDEPLAPGMIKKIEGSGLNNKNINVHLLDTRTGQQMMMTYTQDFVAAALMMYCRGSGIPLPRRANKAVILDKDQVILRVIIGS